VHNVVSNSSRSSSFSRCEALRVGDHRIAKIVLVSQTPAWAWPCVITSSGEGRFVQDSGKERGGVQAGCQPLSIICDGRRRRWPACFKRCRWIDVVGIKMADRTQTAAACCHTRCLSRADSFQRVVVPCARISGTPLAKRRRQQGRWQHETAQHIGMPPRRPTVGGRTVARSFAPPARSLVARIRCAMVQTLISSALHAVGCMRARRSAQC